MGRSDQLPTDALIGVHVLIVDDDRDSRALLKTVLEYCGALATAVGSAREALRILQRVTPDAIVTDIAMPTNDGYWLVEQVRARSADDGGNVPAIAILDS